MEIKLPTRLFTSGENKLVLTAVDDPQEGEGDSWLTYDALRLIQDPAGKPADQLPDSPQVRVDPTIFYVHQGGGVAEVAAVTVTLDEPVRSGDIALSVAGQQLRSPIVTSTTTGADFGQWRQELAIPELNGPTDAEVTIRVNGKTHRSHVTLVPLRLRQPTDVPSYPWSYPSVLHAL